jgi:hypothetical protein
LGYAQQLDGGQRIVHTTTSVRVAKAAVAGDMVAAAAVAGDMVAAAARAADNVARQG